MPSGWKLGHQLLANRSWKLLPHQLVDSGSWIAQIRPSLWSMVISSALTLGVGLKCHQAIREDRKLSHTKRMIHDDWHFTVKQHIIYLNQRYRRPAVWLPSYRTQKHASNQTQKKNKRVHRTWRLKLKLRVPPFSAQATQGESLSNGHARPAHHICRSPELQH